MAISNWLHGVSLDLLRTEQVSLVPSLDEADTVGRLLLRFEGMRLGTASFGLLFGVLLYENLN